MSIQFRRAPSTRIEWAKRGIVTAVLMLSAMTAIAADKAEPDKRQISGEEIFRREWLPNDPRSHGGDGLGPVFNDSSCVACHNQGGIGGGGLCSSARSLKSGGMSLNGRNGGGIRRPDGSGVFQL